MIDLLVRLQESLQSRYAIERELGHGGMATVFLARDLRLGRPVAIKVVRPALERAVALSPGDALWLAQLGEAQALAGNVERASAILQELEAQSRTRYVAPYHLAYVYTGLGQLDRAMDDLEQPYEQRSGSVYGIRGSFLFAPPRSHPRFKALLRKMNFA